MLFPRIDDRPALARFALRSGAILSLIVAALVLIFDTEASPFFIRFRPSSNAIPLPLYASMPAAIALGMGFGTQVALFRFNRHRLRTVFRPNPGRLLCSFALALLLPVATFMIFPLTNLYVLYGLADGLIDLVGSGEARRSRIESFLAPALAFPLITLPGSYIVTSLIISGIRSRLVRIALFGQAWLAVYGAMLIIFGDIKGF